MSTSRCVAVVIASVGLLIAGCVNTVAGQAVGHFDDPDHVAGMSAEDGASGLRPNAIGPVRTVTNGDGGPDDVLAAQAISDIEEFWTGAFTDLGGAFKPVAELLSWDAADANVQFCQTDMYNKVNAAYCPTDDTVGWDRGELLPELRSGFDDMAVAIVFAHEYGHVIQFQAHLITDDTPDMVMEQQADCLAGVYMRAVAENTSPRFTLSTGNGLNKSIAAMLVFGDPVSSDATGVGRHGSAFERISAFQFGFTDGLSACLAIDADEIMRRQGDLPINLPENETGEVPVSEESVKSIVDVLTTLYRPANPPTLSFEDQPCPETRPSPPASYCPATNTISVDLPGLAKIATPSTGFGRPIVGDYTAYSAVVSRYMLAIEHDDGLALDTRVAALRTACLTGNATAKMSHPTELANGTPMMLSAGDLDEAVSGLLTNGLAAADVKGISVPSGFSRVDAFRTGVLGEPESCKRRYP